MHAYNFWEATAFWIFRVWISCKAGFAVQMCITIVILMALANPPPHTLLHNQKKETDSAPFWIPVHPLCEYSLRWLFNGVTWLLGWKGFPTSFEDCGTPSASYWQNLHYSNFHSGKHSLCINIQFFPISLLDAATWQHCPKALQRCPAEMYLESRDTTWPRMKGKGKHAIAHPTKPCHQQTDFLCEEAFQLFSPSRSLSIICRNFISWDSVPLKTYLICVGFPHFYSNERHVS